jgi:uncharacterized protein YjbI with pentapeptide repeats
MISNLNVFQLKGNTGMFTKTNSLFLSVLVGLLLLVANATHAFDPADREKLRKTKNCPNCDLSDANLSEERLPGANLSGANLSGTKLFHSYLAGANLSGANLFAANLSRSNLSGANLTNADLSGANFSYAIWTDGKQCENWSYSGCNKKE